MWGGGDKRNLLHNWVKQSFRTFFRFIALLRSPQLCPIQMTLNATGPFLRLPRSPPPPSLPPSRVEMSHNIGDLVCHSLSLSLSLPSLLLGALLWSEKQEKDYCIIQDAGVEDLIWGILRLLSHIAAKQGALSFTPSCGAYQRGKHTRYSWVSEMFNYLVKAQKGFRCPRLKVSLEGMEVISVSSADAGLRL